MKRLLLRGRFVVDRYILVVYIILCDVTARRGLVLKNSLGGGSFALSCVDWHREITDTCANRSTSGTLLGMTTHEPRVQVTLQASEHADVKAFALMSGLTRSGAIAHMVREWLATNKDVFQTRNNKRKPKTRDK